MTSLKRAAVALALIAASLFMMSTAQADENGFYVGGGVGQARYPQSGHLELGDVLVEGENGERYDQAWSLFAGYRINRYFGVEAGYVDLGQASLSMSDPTGATDSVVDVGFGVEGATLAMVGFLPFGNWDVHVKAGVLFVESQLDVVGTVDSEPLDASVSGESFDGFVALGVGYTLADRWHFAVDLTHFSNNGESEAGQADVMGIGATVTYRF